VFRAVPRNCSTKLATELSQTVFAAGHPIRSVRETGDRSQVRFDGVSTEISYLLLERGAGQVRESRPTVVALGLKLVGESR
jgi:hypothetical protein